VFTHITIEEDEAEEDFFTRTRRNSLTWVLPPLASVSCLYIEARLGEDQVPFCRLWELTQARDAEISAKSFAATKKRCAARDKQEEHSQVGEGRD
jgi:hypothetical protein